MSAFIGSVNAPHSSSPNRVAVIYASTGGVELEMSELSPTFNPIAARNLAALLVRASEEVERMRDRAATHAVAAAPPRPPSDCEGC